MFSKDLHLDGLMIKVGMGEPTCGRGTAVKTTMHKMKGRSGTSKHANVASTQVSGNNCA